MVAQLQKTPAQLLFERIIRTWVSPEIQKRVDTSRQAGPIHLRLGRILWIRACRFIGGQVVGGPLVY